MVRIEPGKYRVSVDTLTTASNLLLLEPDPLCRFVEWPNISFGTKGKNALFLLDIAADSQVAYEESET